ncbi:MAG: hypothetical protein ACK42D_02855 [Candidatus Paceibacteria bacterium]
MNKNIILGVILALIIVVGGVAIYQLTRPAPTVVVQSTVDVNLPGNSNLSVARDAVLGYEFSYRDGQQGYITLEDNGSTHPDFVSGIILANWSEYEEFISATDAREGSPTMNVRVYNNSKSLTASAWLKEHGSEVHYVTASNEEATTVAGVPALYLLTDGLYQTNTYVVAHNNHIYVLSGSYLDVNDQINTDFEALVESFTFIDNSSRPQGRIDPAVACRYALTYMSFASGEDADAFVAECEAGEHPEVINRYIESLGIDGAII